MAEHERSPQWKDNFLDIRKIFEKYLVPSRFEPGAPDSKSGVLTS